MPNNNHRDILDNISSYSTDKIVELLRKNNLSECCEAVVRHQVDGAALLHLTKRDSIQKLDLTEPLRWSLCQFVEALNRSPRQYLDDENGPFSPLNDSEAFDNESDHSNPGWSTDWGSSDSEHSDNPSEMYSNYDPQQRKNSWNGASKSPEAVEENENIYANGDEVETLKKSPKVGHKFEALERLLTEQLGQGQVGPKRPKPPDLPKQPPNLTKHPPTPRQKPEMGPKPAVVRSPYLLSPPKTSTKTVNPVDHGSHTVPKVQPPGSAVLPPGTSTSLPKPPLRQLNIGDSDSDSDGDKFPLPDYVKPRSLPRPLPRPPSPSGRTDIGRQLLGGLGSRLADEVADMIVRIKRGLLRCCHAQSSEYPEPLEPPEPPERSQEKQASLTFPKTGRDSQRSDGGRGTRPLPQTPSDRRSERSVETPGRTFDVPSYTEQPWFHNVQRTEAIALVSGGNSNFSTTPPNGYFLVRPSIAKANQPWTLVLWYKTKVYNIPVRQRRDSRYALGSVKYREQSFLTIEDLINFCKKEEIPLTSSTGEHVGVTRLTESPPRKKE